MFKKIYIEITNSCNLNCSFCSKDKRKKNILSVFEFEHIMKSIDKYTNYIYLHVLGEPLLHKDLDQILKIAKNYNKKVNITTNGTLLKEKENILLQNKDIIRQINISVHAYPKVDNYFEILDDVVCNILKNSNITFSYRLWNIDNNVCNDDFINFIASRYDLDFDYLNNSMSIKLQDNLYLNKDYVFEWPSLDNVFCNEFGKCYGTITHVGILSDGTVVPCCLDSKGIINLGNIFETDFNKIIESERFKKINEGFKKGIKHELLCKKCSFDKIRLNKK